VTRKELPGLREARRMRAARRGPPSEYDRPQHPSLPPRVLPGQVDIFGTTHGLEAADERQEGEAA
jgi:hypothetical protein